ncbi:MAG: YceI family protein [bacterium]
MRHLLRTATLALPLLLLPTLGWTNAAELLTLQPQSKLWVEGTSSIKSWSCKSGDVNAVVEATSANAVSQLLTGDKAVKSVAVTLTTEKLECGNGTMNDHMKNALKAKDVPSIEFKVASYDLTRGADGISGTLNGTLSLGGVNKPIAVAATGTSEAGALHVIGSYELKMTDYDLKPPTLMFGRIKVGDNVTVKFDLLLKN